MSGSSATDFVTYLTDVRKFGNGFCNVFNGCQEEGRGNSRQGFQLKLCTKPTLTVFLILYARSSESQNFHYHSSIKRSSYDRPSHLHRPKCRKCRNHCRWRWQPRRYCWNSAIWGRSSDLHHSRPGYPNECRRDRLNWRYPAVSPRRHLFAPRVWHSRPSSTREPVHSSGCLWTQDW